MDDPRTAPGWSARTPKRLRWRAAAAIAALLSTLGTIPPWTPDLIVAPAQAQNIEPKRFPIVIRHREVEPAMRVIRALQGDTVEITITSDEAAELHLHGYDILIPLEAGKPAVINLVAKIAGRFSLEAHRFGAPGTAADARRQKEVTLLYLEVYPR